MKRILFLLLFLPMFTFGQGISIPSANPTTTAIIKGGFVVDSIQVLALRDTVWPAWYPGTLRKRGGVVFRTADSLPYFYTGAKWTVFGTGSGGGADSTTYFTTYRADTMRSNIYAAISGGSADSSVFATLYRLDSTRTRINTDLLARVKYSDTAAMLAPYLREIDTTAMLVNYAHTNGDNATGVWPISITGSAPTWTVGRTLSITGDLGYTSPSFDGSGNVTAAGTLATVNGNVGSFGSSTSIPSFTVNGKGLITAASGSVVIAPAGTLTGNTLASGVLTTSITSTGTLTAGSLGTGYVIGRPTMTLGGDADGDMYYRNGGVLTRLAIGTSAQHLVGGTVPVWLDTAVAGTGDLLAANNLSDVADLNTSLNNILPAQGGNAGKVLETDGSNATWETPSAGGGADTSALTTNTPLSTTLDTVQRNSVNSSTMISTNQLQQRNNGLGVTQDTTKGISLANYTAATAGNQQMSPALRLVGQGWKTNATAASQTVEWLFDVLPVQGATPTSTLQIKSLINQASLTTQVSITTNGLATFNSITNSICTTSASNVARKYTAYSAESATSGTVLGYSDAKQISPASGTMIYNSISLTGTMNQTGGANGIIRGLYINPTLTSAADFRGIEVTRGSIAFPYKAATATYPILNDDYAINCTSGTFTATLPTAVGCAGRIYFVTNSGAGTITLGTTSSQTFANVVATPTTYTLATLTGVVVMSDGANWLKVSSF